jgi:DNA-binding NtrC family response regulator
VTRPDAANSHKRAAAPQVGFPTILEQLKVEESMPSQPTLRILVVDDQKAVSETIASTLRSRGYQVVTASSNREALQRLKNTYLQLVITDLTLLAEFELMSAIRWRLPNLPVIAMGGTYTVDGVHRTVNRFYAKGKHSPDKLVSMVDELLSAHHRHPRQGTGGRVHLRTPGRGEQE